jgi:hypothetical protein
MADRSIAVTSCDGVWVYTSMRRHSFGVAALLVWDIYRLTRSRNVFDKMIFIK